MQSLLDKIAAMTNQAVPTVIEKKVSTGRVGKVGVNRIPEGMIIRLLPISGEVYPSPQVVSRFNLEYKNLETFELEKKTFNKSKLNPTNNSLLVEEDIENHEDLSCGFDIIDTAIWPNFPKNAGIRLLYIAAVARYAGKVDLFNSCKYVTEGKIDGLTLVQGDAKTTVSEQGGNEYTKSGELLALICDVYGLDEEAIKAGEKFVDLEIRIEAPMVQYIKDSNGELVEDKFALWQVPKTVSRGEEKGNATITTRIGINPMVFIPINIVELQTKYPKTLSVGEGVLATDKVLKDTEQAVELTEAQVEVTEELA